MDPGPILIGLPGTELDAQSRRWLAHPRVGGVVLFSRNFDNREQLLQLVAEIRSARSPRLLVAIDQEGGRVQRLKEGFTRLPPLAVLGRLYRSDPVKATDMAYRHGRVMATEMLALGIDLSFAPVLDLDQGSCVIGDRAFSADPDVVVLLGRAYLAGMHDAGMKTTGKHFPGHGSTRADSHVDDVEDRRSLEEISGADLRPFRELAGSLDAMMIAHVVYPEVDDRPAGYSRRWLRDILRGEIGYRGVIVSDDLGMHAAKVVGSLSERVRRCLQAGCDLVLVCQPEDVERMLSRPEALTDGLRVESGSPVAGLYGLPTVDRRELQEVAREGIREWGHWRKTLEQLGEQKWI
jgi:beta-N-acetylhexosaminidase